jgi:hypothetical protein
VQIDQNKFMNLIVEKTTQRLNQLSNQVIVLEAQLQLAADLNKELQTELDKIKKKNNKQQDDFQTPS